MPTKESRTIWDDVAFINSTDGHLDAFYYICNFLKAYFYQKHLVTLRKHLYLLSPGFPPNSALTASLEEREKLGAKEIKIFVYLKEDCLQEHSIRDHRKYLFWYLEKELCVYRREQG